MERDGEGEREGEEEGRKMERRERESERETELDKQRERERQSWIGRERGRVTAKSDGGARSCRHSTAYPLVCH